jgi:hypothetical protein
VATANYQYVEVHGPPISRIAARPAAP